MKLYMVGVRDEDKLIGENIDIKTAVEAAKNYLEIYFDQDKIDDDAFYVTEDEDNGNEVIRVYLVANSFGVLSDFYVEIRNA